jgi:hypothetical protein
MNWLKRKVIKWVREDWENERKGNLVEGVGVKEHSVDADPVLTFRIYSATNGQIIEFRRWDQKADRNHNSTYIVDKNKDLGEFVNKCLSLEMLK